MCALERGGKISSDNGGEHGTTLEEEEAKVPDSTCTGVYGRFLFLGLGTGVGSLHIVKHDVRHDAVTTCACKIFIQSN